MYKQELLKTAKPILFNTEMVKAILEGRKAQTRRVVNGGFLDDGEAEHIKYLFDNGKYEEAQKNWGFEAKYKIGNIIWVREPARVIDQQENGIVFKYLSDGKESTVQIPERFYPRPKWITNLQGVPNGCIKEMARIFLKVTDVRVERLQDISFDEIFKEGCNLKNDLQYCELTTFARLTINSSEEKILKWWINLWNKTAPKGFKWEDNPYVFVYEFERIEL